MIFKVLTNHLKLVLRCFILENQGAFVGGRQIQDNIFIVHELFHYLKKKSDSSRFEFALKIDMAKVYDHV